MVDLQPIPQPESSPITPPVPPTTPIPQPVPIPPKSKLATILISFIVIALIGFGSYFGYQMLRKTTSSQNSDTEASPKPSTVETTLKDFTPMSDASNLLAYIQDIKKEVNGDEEIVLINPNTKKETILPIKKANLAYKYYGSDFLFYLTQNDKGEYHILNLKTGIDQTFDLLDHSDKTARVSININNITEISPDGKYLVFNGSFFSPCPSPSPFPSGFEGGFGPCGPDESLEDPTGYYLYDFQNKKSTYLQVSTFRASRWDTKNNKLYFVDYDTSSTKSLDLINKSVAFVDSTSNFGYFTYPLVKQDKLVKFEASTGDSGPGPFGKIFIVKNSDHSEVEIDSTNTWTDIQPFITANDNETDILYRRSTNINGLHRNSIYRYNLLDGKTSRVTKDDNSLSYSNYVSWISDHEIVTSVDVIEEDNYNNQNQNLVKIDLNTLEETPLTEHGQVMYFNSQ